jgi:hypothetical protein
MEDLRGALAQREESGSEWKNGRATMLEKAGTKGAGSSPQNRSPHARERS